MVKRQEVPKKPTPEIWFKLGSQTRYWPANWKGWLAFATFAAGLGFVMARGRWLLDQMIGPHWGGWNIALILAWIMGSLVIFYRRAE